MKIAYIVPSLANRGPVIVVQELVRQFSRHGHDCTVFYFDDVVELSMDCPARRIKPNRSVDFSGFDVIHSHGIRPDRYVTRYARKNGRTRYMTTMHNYMFDDLGYLYNPVVSTLAGNWWLARWTRRHDRVIALSGDAAKYYHRWVKRDKLTYAYNTRSIDPSDVALSPEESAMLARFKGRSTLIGMNALMIGRKGIDLVIRALADLPHHKLFVAGDGPLKSQLERLAHEVEVSDRCLFAGYRKDAFRFISHYDIYALPSRSEGFPLALLEAAVFATPSVCSDSPLNRELWNEREISFFKLENVPSLQKAIVRATGNRGMGEAMRRRYEKEYSPDNFYRRHLEIYTNQ